MDDFPDLLARDFGFKPQGKAAPMAQPRSSSIGSFGSFPSSNFALGSDFVRSSSSSRSQVPVFDDHDGGAAADGLIFDDVFGGPPKYTASDSRTPAPPTFDHDDVFGDQKISKSSSTPVYDKPVYDEDIFEGISGLKSTSTASSAKFENVFASISSSPPKQKKQDSSPFDDLLGDLGRKDTEGKRMDRERDEKKYIPSFDDLIPGFGRSSSPPSERLTPELNKSHKSYHDSTRVAPSVMDDLFVTSESASDQKISSSGVSSDLLEEAGKHGNFRSRKTDRSSVSGGVFDDLDPLGGLGKSMPDIGKRGKDINPERTESTNGLQSTTENFQGQWQRKEPVDFQGSHQSPFDLPSGSVGGSASPPHVNCSPNVANSRANTTSGSGFDYSDDVWLTVSEIPLFTQPTSAPPPSRPPPPRPTRPKRSESGSFSSRNTRKLNDRSSSVEGSVHSYSPGSGHPPARSVTSQIDELEDFATAKARCEPNGYPAEFGSQDFEANSAAAAAAMKEAMEKAEAKFRHAKEMRGREHMTSFRSKESARSEKDDYQEKECREEQDGLDNERQQRLSEEEEKEQRRLEKEMVRARELEREREEREREQIRLEKERIERERELARRAVERATREARERAAAEARAKAQKVAVEKAAAEARERAEKAAVQRAQAEARERAAMEAREKAEKAAAEMRQRANAEAREREAREREARARAERAAVERAAAEARERAAAGARERAAAQARASQQRNDNDLESFFASRPGSAPRASTNASESAFDTHNNRGPPETARAATGASSSMRKASSTTNIVDDLGSIFGAAASPSGVFQEVDGETEERRRARLERHQRTQERAAKALAEKNERDLNAQREQAEKYRIAETLDVEIRRWAAGKEGNLRAMLSTLQYVLWPECGWQPVSLTDLITAASVKKVYRKATLCIHPDKVQQKGATLQQKYVAEKVFDLLKEAWNKFNSEELF